MRNSAVRLARAAAAAAPPFLLLLLLAGCAGVGPQRLDMDHMGYASALGEGLKRQMLLNMVRLRYADVPAFVSGQPAHLRLHPAEHGPSRAQRLPERQPGQSSDALRHAAIHHPPDLHLHPGHRRPLRAILPAAARAGGAAFPGAERRADRPAVPHRLAIGERPDRTARTGAGDIAGSVPRLRSAPARLAARCRPRARSASTLERRPAGGNHARIFLLLDGDTGRATAAARRFRELLGVEPATRQFEVVYGRTRRGPRQWPC